MDGLAIAKGIICLEAGLAAALEAAEQSITELQEVMDSQVAGPLAHALRMSAGYFTDHPTKRHHKLARAV